MGMPPGGIPAMVEQASAAFQQFLASSGIRLPAGVTPSQAAIGMVIAVVVVLYIVSRFLSMTVLMMVGMAIYWGTQVDSGRIMLARGSEKVSRIVGRPLPPQVALVALCVIVALAGQSIFGGRAKASSSNASTESSGFAEALREAYEQGYADGADQKEMRPPKHIPSPYEQGSGPKSQSSSSGFGMGSLLKYGLVGYTIFNLGKTPSGWDPQIAMMNAKANPMQAVMMLVMLSGFLF
jgi:hypothetical protein